MLGIERIYYFEDIETEVLLKRFFRWGKLPDYTTYYNDLQRFTSAGDSVELMKSNEQFTKRILSKPKRFINDTLLRFFEEYRHADTGFLKEIPYVGKMKLYRNNVRKGLNKNWCRVYEGTKIIEWTEIEHRAQTWSKSRRIVLIRTSDTSDFEEPYFSEEIIWEYQALITNMDDDGGEIWKFYNHRASMENYIKESKNGFGSDQISNDDFYANYADLWLKMLAYNIYILFGIEICDAKHTAFTIARFRRKFLMIPARLVTHARQWKLKLSNTFNHFSEWLKMLK